MAAVGLQGRGVADRSCPPSMPALVEQGARELSSFCLAWVDGGDTKEGEGPPAAWESRVHPGPWLRVVPGSKQVWG